MLRRGRQATLSAWLGLCFALALGSLALVSRREPVLEPAPSLRRAPGRARAGPADAARLGFHHAYSRAAPGNGTQGELPEGHWTGAAGSCTGERLFGTAEAQRRLHALQHPADCAAARYLVTPPHLAGIGSIIHMAGQALAVASALGRVLAMEPDPQSPFHDPAWCGRDGAFDACYFLPLSPCRPPAPGGAGPATIESWEQAAALNATRVLRVDKRFLSPSSRDPRSFAAFGDLLAASPVPPGKHYYWWRAQAAAYLVRPRPRMLREVAALRAQHFGGRDIPPGTISVHIRHGDKATEYADTGAAVYLERAAQAVRARPSTLRRSLFLSTDDPQALAALAGVPGWRVAYAGVGRKGDPRKSIPQYARERGPGREMAESLLNLDLALECDAWVGTLTSNWCRLIDELRATVRCKAGGVYLDAQQAHPPENLEW